MSKSFWNRMESIPIRLLNEEELRQAMKEWAEGNRHLERFLWLCYENGVETSGCHSGHNKSIPYIDFRVDTSSRSNLKRLLATTIALKEAQIFLTFNGNPRSGPDWHRPVINVSPLRAEDTTKFLKNLSSSLKTNKEIYIDEFIETFLDIYEFMKDKETPLNFRIVVVNDIKYIISVECLCNNRDWNYYSELFFEAGLTQYNNPKNKGMFTEWGYAANEKEEFNFIMQKLYQVLTTKWNLELPSEITEDMTNNIKALAMRRKFGTDRHGVELLNEWLNENKEPEMKDVNY